jgi:L-fuculose-phosphate aldolase
LIKDEIIACVRGLYAAGLTTSVSGNQSARVGKYMWITPSGIPRDLMHARHLVKVDIRTGKILCKGTPSREEEMHRKIYTNASKVKAIVHTHSPFTLAVSLSSKFIHVIEEAKLIVGKPAVIDNLPSGSGALADAVAHRFRIGARAVVVRNHGVVAGGQNIYAARAIVEALEEWSKVLVLSKVLGGPKHSL